MKGEEMYIASRSLYFRSFFDASMVCGHFSLELILKCILLQNGVDWEEGHRGHDLKLLFDKLINKGFAAEDKIVGETLECYMNYYWEFKYPEWIEHEARSGIDIRVIESLDYTITILRCLVGYSDKKWFGDYSPINTLLSGRRFNQINLEDLIYRNKYIG